MSNRAILAGPASKELGEEIAKKLDIPILNYECKIFPDGETKLRFEGAIAEKTIFIIQSTYPPTDTHLFQLLLASHYLSQEGAKIIAVIPYLAYARQDKQFLPGEVVSLSVVSHLLRASGVKRVITVDIHSPEGLGLFSIPIYSVSAIPSLVYYVRSNLSLNNPLIVSPDFGGSKRVEAFASLYGAEYLQLAKKRDRITGEVQVERSKIAVNNRDVIIVDDIISTGGTVVSACQLLKEAGASSVIAVCVHPLLVGDALKRLRSAGIDDIIGTNTVPSPVSRVDVSDAIASHLKTIEE